MELKLNKRIQICKEVETKNELGSKNKINEPFVKLWAEVNSKKADDIIQGGEMFNSELIDVIIEYRKSITNKMVVVYENNSYNILHVQELGDKEGMKLLARKKNK